MWIFLGIAAFIVLLVIVILLLPVYIKIFKDSSGEMKVLYKFLFKTFGEEPDPDNQILILLKKSTGIDNLEKDNLKKDIKNSGIATTTMQTVRLIVDLLSEIFSVLKYCTAKRFELDVVCAGCDAAKAAQNYGEVCSIAYPLIGLAHSLVKVKKRGRKVNIRCDYNAKEDSVDYNFVISIKLFRLIIMFLKVAFKEARRRADKVTEMEPSKQKTQPSKK